MSGCVIKRSLSCHWFLIRLATLHRLHWMLHVLVGILGECAWHVSTTQSTRIVRASMPPAEYVATSSKRFLFHIFLQFYIVFLCL